jgi:MFS family permease
MKTSSFWMIGLGHAFAVMVVSTLMLHLPLHLVEGRGFSEVQAAGIAAGMMACQIPGQAIAGYLGERIGKRKLTTAAMLMHGAALLILAQYSSYSMMILFAVMNGVAWGIRGPLMQTMRAEYFGRKHFGMIMGWSSVLIMVGSFSGPMIAGWLFDIAGSYETGFTFIAMFPIAGSLFFLFAGPPKKNDTGNISTY